MTYSRLLVHDARIVYSSGSRVVSSTATYDPTALLVELWTRWKTLPQKHYATDLKGMKSNGRGAAHPSETHNDLGWETEAAERNYSCADS